MIVLSIYINIKYKVKGKKNIRNNNNQNIELKEFTVENKETD